MLPIFWLVKYDDKPENWFYMVQGTLADQVARDAEAESAEAKNILKRKLNSHEIVISHTCRYEG